MEAKYWTERHYKAVEKAGGFPELLLLAYDIIDSIPKPVSMLSGPISSGGSGSLTKNLETFAQTISTLEKQGEHIFNQLPFEDKFIELSKHSKLTYFTPILEDFFLPILKSGKIKKIWFMSGWETSTGAKWEYEQTQKLGIEQCFISSENSV